MQKSKAQLKSKKFTKMLRDKILHFDFYVLSSCSQQAGQARLPTPEAAGNGGQALISLLFFSIIAITIATSAIIITASNSLSSDQMLQGTEAYAVAESGAENALILLLRNPNYSGETLTVGLGTATITVTGTNPTVVHSVGVIGNFKRNIDIGTTFINGKLNIVSWKEL